MGFGYRSAINGGMGADDSKWREGKPPFFRRGWEIAAMVGAFVLFWPVGLAFLGYLIWRKKKGEGADMSGDFRRWKAGVKSQFGGGGFARGSGNLAFDDYRSEVMRRLEEERRRLDDEQRAFGEFMLRLRRARDQEEFDRFMADRNGSAPTAGPQGGPAPSAA
ncbi:MAG: DUF2852 domain-containing protein [Bosea sp. (in: a-proteobacteria)]